jgi:hypothetical protein
MNTTLKIATVAVLALAVGVGLVQLRPSTNNVGSDPSLSASPTPSPSPTQVARYGGDGRQLEPGRYRMKGPDDSLGLPDWTAEVQFGAVGAITTDPCGDGAPTTIGPGVDAFVAAVSAIPGVEATDAEPVTLAGYDGQHLDLTIPVDAGGCDPYVLWLTPEWSLRSYPGWVSRLWVLDVDGVRFVVDASYPVDASPELQAEVQRIVDSIEIAP